MGGQRRETKMREKEREKDEGEGDYPALTAHLPLLSVSDLLVVCPHHLIKCCQPPNVTPETCMVVDSLTFLPSRPRFTDNALVIKDLIPHSRFLDRMH